MSRQIASVTSRPASRLSGGKRDSQIEKTFIAFSVELGGHAARSSSCLISSHRIGDVARLDDWPPSGQLADCGPVPQYLVPTPRTVRATRYVTPLREGGSLPAIIEADDDGMYVLKFKGAGQGPRALI